MKKPIVSIIMGSDSDLPVMRETAEILDEFDIAYEFTIISAHRTPDRMLDLVKTAEGRGVKVVIAGAGGAAHLPGVAASLTYLPVIGVPIHTKTLQGVDSLYSIVQMPSGIPVATVAINGAKNAGLLAIQILGLQNGEIMDKFKKYREDLKRAVEEKASRLEKLGYKNY